MIIMANQPFFVLFHLSLVFVIVVTVVPTVMAQKAQTLESSLPSTTSVGSFFTNDYLSSIFSSSSSSSDNNNNNKVYHPDGLSLPLESDDVSDNGITTEDGDVGRILQEIEEGFVCDTTIPFDESIHKKREFSVGVLAIRGFEAAYNEFNKTFNEYLTATAGQRFDPPISFRLEPLNFLTLFSSAETSAVDFIYVNPSAFSCIDSEYDAQSLTSQVSRRNIKGNVYNLKKFGGVIAVLANRTDINSIQDLKDKTIAAASLSGLGSGQMQYKKMIDNGMNYLQDPRQLVFTSNQGKVVKGLLSGDFDVGFIRTDQLERSKDLNGDPVDLSLFKVIDPLPGLEIDGVPFPFESSTELYAEWNIASLTHVPTDVSKEVQRAMMQVADFGAIGKSIRKCYEEDYVNNTSFCDAQNLTYFSDPVKCGTTREKATLALEAMEKGKYSGWTTTLSYMQLRSMQEATGFISMEPETKIWRCIRSAELYDAISCPAGTFIKSKDEVENGCASMGLECKEGFQCICRPCEVPYELVCVDSVKFGDGCVSLVVFLSGIIAPIVLLVAFFVYFYLRYKKRQADSVWVIEEKDLEFGEPPICVGRGTFGLVLLADYRGTQVAVKRVIPPKGGGKNTAFDQDNFVSVRSQATDYSWNFDIENPGMKSIAPTARHYRQRIRGMRSGSSAGSFQDLRPSRAKRGGTRGTQGTQKQTFTTMKQTEEGSGWLCFSSKNKAEAEYENMKREFVTEIRYLAKLRHPCITTVMGAVMPTAKSEPMLVMEFMNYGSLFDVLNDDVIKLKPEQILAILQDVAQGLRFLHSAKPQVIHGDLKAQNILIDMNFMAKVSDFGMSAKSQTTAVGTPYWMAPELLTGESINSAASDVYSYGIIIYEIYSGKPPYEGEEYEEVIEAICDPMIMKRPVLPIQCPAKVAALMRECVRHNPEQRPQSDQLDLQLKVELKVNERTTRLEALNKELEEANGQIASASAMQLQHFASMSHEIRTPLNCIIGLSSLLEETDLNAMQKESIDMIVNSGQLLRTIVDDVLDYSKLESGNAQTLIQKTNLQDTLDAVVHLIKTNKVSVAKELRIRTLYDTRLPQHVDTDSRRVQQILFNLLGNAIKFSKAKQAVEFGVNIFDSRILRFTVKDFGKGIGEKDYGKIFEPFRQTGTGLTNAEGGTGLGLAITKKLVEALNGQISVKSVLGEWTEFTVDFPFTNSPFDITEISPKLTNAQILIVGNLESPDVEKTTEVLDAYRIDYAVLSSMSSIATMLARKELLQGAAYVCICQENLFDAETFTIFQKTKKCSLITFGPDFTVERSPKHFRSLAETFPSVLAKTILVFVNQQSGDGTSAIDASIKSVMSLESPWSALRILIAEDNLVNQKVLTRILNRLDVDDISLVNNGEEAVKREAKEPFDLVLMDMQMPIMDGIEACQEINKRTGGHKKAKIVFVTAHVADSFKQTCIDNGAIGYLPKPCTKEAVKGVLKHAMKHTDGRGDSGRNLGAVKE